MKFALVLILLLVFFAYSNVYGEETKAGRSIVKRESELNLICKGTDFKISFY